MNRPQDDKPPMACCVACRKVIDVGTEHECCGEVACDFLEMLTAVEVVVQQTDTVAIYGD